MRGGLRVGGTGGGTGDWTRGGAEKGRIAPLSSYSAANLACCAAYAPGTSGMPSRTIASAT